MDIRQFVRRISTSNSLGSENIWDKRWETEIQPTQTNGVERVKHFVNVHSSCIASPATWKGVAATMLRRPEPPECRVKPSPLGATAIDFPHSIRKTLLLLLRIQRYMWRIITPEKISKIATLPPWKYFCRRQWMHWLRSNSWVIKHGAIWFYSCKSLKNDKCQSCQVS